MDTGRSRIDDLSVGHTPTLCAFKGTHNMLLPPRESTIKPFNTKTYASAYNAGYSDGAISSHSCECAFQGGARLAYVFGYALGADATQRIWQRAA